MDFLNNLEDANDIKISGFRLLLIASIVSGILVFSYLLLLNLWQILVGVAGLLFIPNFNSSDDVVLKTLSVLKHFLGGFLLFTILIFIKLYFRSKTYSLHQIATDTASWAAILNYVIEWFYIFRYLTGDGGYGIMFGLFFSVILFPIFFLLVRFLILICFRLGNRKTLLSMVFLLVISLFAFQFCRVLIINIRSSLSSDNERYRVDMSQDAYWYSEPEFCLRSTDKNSCLFSYSINKYDMEMCSYMSYRYDELTSHDWFLKNTCYNVNLSALDNLECDKNPDVTGCKNKSLINLSLYKAIKKNDKDVCKQLGTDEGRCVKAFNDYKVYSGLLNAVPYLFWK